MYYLCIAITSTPPGGGASLEADVALLSEVVARVSAQVEGGEHLVLADGVGISVGAAGRVSRLGTALERFPRLRAGVLSGAMAPDAVRAAADGIAATVADLRGPARDEARAKGEAIIARVCEVGVTAEVDKVAASLIFHLDPEPAARRALQAMERREVRIGKIGAAAVVSLVLDTMTATQLRWMPVRTTRRDRQRRR